MEEKKNRSGDLRQMYQNLWEGGGGTCELNKDIVTGGVLLEEIKL
jgi:hypothetical protein